MGKRLIFFEVELEDPVLMQDVTKVEQFDRTPTFRASYVVENVPVVMNLNVDAFGKHVVEGEALERPTLPPR